MEKSLLCCTALPVPPSGRVKKCKSCLFERPEWTGKKKEENISGWMGWGGSHDADRVQWEQFPNLLTGLRWCCSSLGGSTCQVVPWLWRRSGTCRALWSVQPEKAKTKKKKKKTAKCPWSGATRSLSFTLQFLLWDSMQTTHSCSIWLLNSLPCSFFQPNFFPLYLSTSPYHIHHRTQASICYPCSLLLFFF